MLTILLDRHFNTLSAIDGRLIFISSLSRVCVCEMRIAEVLDDRPSICIGKHATNNHVVMRIGLEANKDFTPGEVLMVRTSNLLLYTHLTLVGTCSRTL
tara:strand:+ start:13276 stop:13572 length:297 start_codon:yes stop_codon:yes gene_type:complete